MAAAAAPGSAAPVIGRPMTSRSAPSASACSGVAIARLVLRVGAGRAHPGGDQHDALPDLAADGGDLVRRADERAGARADGQRSQSSYGVGRRTGQADGVEGRRPSRLVSTVTAAMVTSGAASTAARTMSARHWRARSGRSA